LDGKFAAIASAADDEKSGVLVVERLGSLGPWGGNPKAMLRAEEADKRRNEIGRQTRCFIVGNGIWNFASGANVIDGIFL